MHRKFKKLFIRLWDYGEPERCVGFKPCLPLCSASFSPWPFNPPCVFSCAEELKKEDFEKAAGDAKVW